MQYCHCKFVQLSDEQHEFRSYDGGEHRRNVCLSRSQVAAEYVSSQVPSGGVQIPPLRRTVVDANSIRDLEQKSYRAGWEAGKRQANQTVAEFRSVIERNQQAHQLFVDGLKAQFARELRLAVDAASKGAAVYAEDFDEDGADCRNYAERPLNDDDKHFLKQRADRAATKAHLDKPYWAEGIDPDEP